MNSSSLQWKQRSEPLRRAVGLALALSSDHLDDRNADDGCDLMRRVAFLGGQAGGNPEHGQDAATAEGAGGERKQHRGVHASRECDAQAARGR